MVTRVAKVIRSARMRPLSRGKRSQFLVAHLLTVVLAVAGVVLGLRATLGPLSLFVPVNSPMNAQSAFALVLILLLLLGRAARDSAGKSEMSERGYQHGNRTLGGPAKLAWFILASVATAFVLQQILFFYFLSDDFILLKFVKLFSTDQIVPLFVDGKLGDRHYRPAAFTFLGLAGIWAGSDAIKWHGLGLLLHLLNSALVYALGLRLQFRRWACFLAAAIFASHGSRPEVVAWMPNGIFDLLCTLFLLLGCLSLSTYLEKRHPAMGVCSLAFFSLSQLSKEIGYIAPLLIALIGFASAKGRRSNQWLLPFVASLFTSVLLFVHRWNVLGGIGGYLDPETAQPQVFALSWIGSLKALILRLWAALCFPINWPGFPL